MLTLVAEVLAYDLARDMCDLLSSVVEVEGMPLTARRSALASLKVRSCTRLENDILTVACYVGRECNEPYKSNEERLRSYAAVKGNFGVRVAVLRGRLEVRRPRNG